MAENSLLGRVSGAEQGVAVPTDAEKESLVELKAQLEAEVETLDDDDPELKAALDKYAPVFQTMTERTQLYYKYRLATKYGASTIKDKDTRALWIVMRKVLHALRTLGSQM